MATANEIMAAFKARHATPKPKRKAAGGRSQGGTAQ